MVTFPNGEPTPDEKRNIERRFSDRFTGADGKKLILSFVDRVDQKPLVDDLGQSDLSKEDFANVDTLIQTNIFAGHQIVSPVLFGIKTEGQLGATTELQSAYEIFKNTYANDKQHFIESVFNELATIKGATSEIVIIPVEPISFQLTEAALLQIAPKEYLLEKAGIDLSKYAPVNGNTGELAASPANVNESLKNLTGRQYQQLMRVVRQFSQGKITKQQASVMLSGGLGLSDAEINTMLGVDDDPETEDQFSEHEDEAVKIFEEYGEQREFFNVFRDKPVYSSFEAFVIDNSIDGASDKKILELIKKDPLIAAAVLAKAIGKEVEFVYDRLQHLQDIGAIVKDEVTQARTLTRPINEIIDEPLRTTIEVRYSYEWKKVVPQGQRNSATHPSRPFCARLMQLDRLYTRREIEAISSRLGYSVFDRGGGWWTRPSGYHSPSCRHEWRANVVVKKK
jgi:predicted transcriptional regulator